MLVKALKEIVIESVSASGTTVTRDFYRTGDIVPVTTAYSAQLIADGEAVAYTGTLAASAPFKSETLANPAAGSAASGIFPADAAGVLVNDGNGTLTWSASAGGGGNTSILTDNGDGTFTHNDGAGTLVTFNGAPDQITSLSYSTVTKVLTYTDEQNVATSISLAALAADIYVNAATFNPTTNILTLNDTSTTTAAVTVDMSALRAILTDHMDKTYTFNDGAGTTTLIDARADSTAISPAAANGTGAVGTSTLKARQDHQHPAQGVSADAGNSIAVGTDGLHYFKQAVTTLVFDPVADSLTYTDEAGVAHAIDISGVVNFATVVSPAATDAVGLVGVSVKAARQDHRHPAQAPSANALNAIVAGTDGLHWAPDEVVYSTAALTGPAPAGAQWGINATNGDAYYVSGGNWTPMPVPPADRILEKVTKAAHGFTVLTPVYFNGTTWLGAQANTEASAAQGVVTKVIDANTFEVTTHGAVTIAGHGLGATASTYYLSQTIPSLSAAKPTSGLLQSVLFVRDANTIFVAIGEISSASTAAATPTPLGRASAYRTTVINASASGSVPFETKGTSVNITESLLTNGLVTLVAGKTYRIGAGVRLESPASGWSHWYVRTTGGVNISGAISLDAANSPANNSSLSSTEVIYTPTANETIGLFLDAISPIGEAGPGTYLTVEELPSDTIVSTNVVVRQKQINTQTGTLYTIALADVSNLVAMNASVLNTVRIPTNATTPFAIGDTISVVQYGVGQTNITGDVGVTINSVGGLATINGQYATVTMTKTGADTWLLSGNLV